MGTSGAYGGSSGWSGIGRQTEEWLGSGAGGDAGGDAGDGDPSDGPPPADVPPDVPGNQSPLTSAPLAALIGRLGRRLSSSGGAGGGSGVGAGGGSGGGTATGGRGRSTARASSVGGRAAAGVYGVRSGVAGALAELGLSLDELRGIPKHAQAKRLLEAAMGPSGGISESELRLANAELILWALNEESEPAPIDLANRWVVEYVWQVWITEAGQTIRHHAGNGYDSHRVEQEMRAALEATVSAGSLPDDRPLTAHDFEQAIDSALKSLERIGRTSS